MNQQAQTLNAILQEDCPFIYKALSQRGKQIFFPKAGIMAQTADAKGKQYNATIGTALDEDGSPMRLTALAEQLSVAPKDAYPYAPSFGKPELREKWKQMMLQKNPSIDGQISLPVVTNALTHALQVAMYLFLDAGDDIVLADKFWGNYKLMFAESFNANLVTYNTYSNGGFDVESFRRVINERVDENKKTVLLLNFPNNPSGYSPTVGEVEQIVEVIRDAAERGGEFVVVLDDAYFGLSYEDDVYKESLIAPLGHLHENVLVVKIDGASKEDYAWGFRVGFVTFACKGITEEVCSALEQKAAGVVRGSVSNVCHLSQTLLLNTYNHPEYNEQKIEKYSLMKLRYFTVKEVLATHTEYAECFTPLPYNSGYFLCVQLAEDLDGQEVRQLLLQEFDTGVIAVGNLLRIAYSSLPTKDIAPLFSNIYHACQRVSFPKTPCLV